MRIDSHFHLWRPARGDYGWLTPAAGILYRDYEPQEFAPLLATHGIDAAILVQAAPSAAETEFLLAHAGRHSWIAGVVGWTDLAAGDAPARIATLAGRPKLLGLRPMLQDLDDPAWILGDAVRPALRAMARHGIVFDALVRAAQLPAIRVLATRHPDLSIVLDHFGKPPIGDAPGSEWLDAISALSDAPNVTVKLSGLLAEAPAGADATVLAPYFDHVVHRFGAGRILWGSDWPVLTTAGTYADWLAISHALLAPLGSAARAAILGANAARIYRI
ncbi:MULTISPECIES: amidohydrolase family protein [unclassified Sphingomonas]|jgi:L-fuconolactonase|nr:MULTISPECIES: amidohydrolase family protein [unclassified Sphingomonas]